MINLTFFSYALFVDCGGLLTDSEGTFTTPNYANGTYGNNLACQWLIRAGDGHTISLTFVDFVLEDCCTHDGIQILEAIGGCCDFVTVGTTVKTTIRLLINLLSINYTVLVRY